MPEEIKASPETIRHTADKLDSVSSQIRALLDDVTKEVNRTVGMGASWESRGAMMAADKYKRTSSYYEDFENALKKYTVFLRGAAEAYERQDAEVRRKAEEFLQNDANA